MSHQPIRPAKLAFNQQGTPIAEDFDDVYFSNQNGVAETEFVFLKHNQLPARWAEFERKTYVIGETGFGTGLNFLVAWQAFIDAIKSDQLKHLHFVSFEKFPLDKEQLKQALSQWPELANLSGQLIDQYPVLVTGCHRLEFKGVTLDLWLGDVNEVIQQLFSPSSGLVDSWFLDGFAPSKNPDMWTENLFTHMARLAKSQATFATFTAAGFVKRGLTASGFQVSKPKGFGHKRNMLCGTLTEEHRHLANKQGYYSRTPKLINSVVPPTSITIIGGGIAAANCAYALAKRGYDCRIVCKDDGLAQGASGNHQGGFYPLIHAEHDTVSQIYCHSYLFARQRYEELLAQSCHFSHHWCGTVQVAHNDKTLNRIEKLALNPHYNKDIVHLLSAHQASEIAGLEIPYPALYYPLAGWITPPSLVQALVSAAQQKANVELLMKHQVEELIQTESGWQLKTHRGELNADIVILANGNHVSNFQQTLELPFAPVRGQVSIINNHTPLSQLKTVLCHKGYATPLWRDQQCIGSSFIKQNENLNYSATEQQANLATLQSCFPKQYWAQTLNIGEQARTGVRCTSPDHLPLVGAVPILEKQRQQYSQLHKNKDSIQQPENYPNLYMLAALGSRGLCSAPIMAEILACQIDNQPMPISQPLLNALNPNRFLIRELIKNR